MAFSKLGISLVLPFVLIGCARATPEITFIVPEGFRGLICIWEDRTSSHKIQSEGRSRFSLKIPVSGKIGIQSTNIFFQWHRTPLKFEGRSTANYSELSSAPTDEVLLYGLGTSSYRTPNYESPMFSASFVGTTEEIWNRDDTRTCVSDWLEKRATKTSERLS